MDDTVNMLLLCFVDVFYNAVVILADVLAVVSGGCGT